MSLRPDGYWSVDPEWQGKTAIILAGGSSFTDENMRLIERSYAERDDLRIIAINNSIYRAPWAHVFYFCDLSWFQEHEKKLQDYALLAGWPRPVIYTLENKGLKLDVRRLKNAGRKGLSRDPWAVCTGGNSSYQCINLCQHYGVDRALLVGVDMKGPHWHKGHKNKKTRDETYDRWTRDDWPTMLPGLTIEVINCSPTSRLDIFPKKALKDALSTVRHPGEVRGQEARAHPGGT